MKTVNIFKRYKQEENAFTNGLISILSLSTLDNEPLVDNFFRDVLNFPVFGDTKERKFYVLSNTDGTADAGIRGADGCIWFETKIFSGTLREDQVNSHLLKLSQQPESLRRLVLLTPDDSQSLYIKKFCSDKKEIVHIEWRKVYRFLKEFSREKEGILPEIIKQFLTQISRMVFERDIAGIIQKINFGHESEVFADKYLDEMKNGVWDEWRTPRFYKELDGTGRKLLLYDRTRKAITVEIEIAKVVGPDEVDESKAYPWSNQFEKESISILNKPIQLKQIRLVPGFENFGVHRKDRSPYRNITREQYQALKIDEQTGDDN